MTNERSLCYGKNEWLDNSDVDRGTACLEHLLDHHRPENPIVLEIGPVDEFPLHQAPMKFLKSRRPEVPSGGIGPENLSRDQIQQVLGDAVWIQGEYAEGREDDRRETSQKISDSLGNPPSIIYASHVIENSTGGPISCYRIFEAASEELPDDGLLVVDNAHGVYDKVARHDWPHSKRMLLHSIYHHRTHKCNHLFGETRDPEYEAEAIFVFQRAPEDLAQEEIHRHTQNSIRYFHKTFSSSAWANNF